MVVLCCYILLRLCSVFARSANKLHYLRKHWFLLLSWLEPDGPQSDGRPPWWSREVERRQMWRKLKEERVLPSTAPHIIFHISPICCPSPVPSSPVICLTQSTVSVYFLPFTAARVRQKWGRARGCYISGSVRFLFADIVFHLVNLRLYFTLNDSIVHSFDVFSPYSAIVYKLVSTEQQE